jgi:hypothetical protein
MDETKAFLNVVFYFEIAVLPQGAADPPPFLYTSVGR